MFTTVKIIAFSSWKFFTLPKEQWQYENSQERWDAVPHTWLFNDSCLDPCSLSKSQLVAVCLGFLFPTRGGYWSMVTVLGLLDP